MNFLKKLWNFDHTLFVWFIAFIHTPYPWILMALCLVTYDVHRYITEDKFDTTMLYLDLPTILMLLIQSYIMQNMKDKKDKN